MLSDLFKAANSDGTSDIPQSQSAPRTQFWNEESKPISFSIYDKTPRHLLYIKDQVANQRKNTNVLDSMFEGDALGMTAEEYERYINSQMASETAQNMAVNTAQMDNSQFIAALNNMRQMVGMEPVAPTMPELQQPSWQQAAVAALTGLFSPEHAMDVASVPFQYQLNEQQRQYGELQQGYQRDLNQHNQLMQLAGLEVERAANNADRQFQSDFQREMFGRGANEDRTNAVQGRNFQREMFLREVDFKFKSMDKENQSRVAFAYLGQALNPNSSAAERQSAAEVFNRLTGGNVEAFAGKTLAEQASELDMTLAKNADQRAQNQESRAAELFPLQKEGLANQNKADRIRLEYLPQQLQLDLEAAQAGIDNVYDTIRSRQQGDELALSEQDRAYIGMAQDNARVAMSGLSTQLEQLGVEERALQKEREGAEPTRQKEIDGRLAEIAEQKGGIIDALSEVNGQLKEVDGVLKSKSGIGAQSIKGNLGADMLGTPYSWGGGGAKGPSMGSGKGANTKGFDCSGFTCYVAKQEWGVEIPRTAAAQFASLREIDGSSVMDGDFAYFKSKDGKFWHTGVIFFRDGQPWIRHAPQTGDVVKEQPLSEFESRTSKTFVGFRRARPKDKNIPDKPAIFKGGE